MILLSFPDGRLHGWERWAAGAWITFIAVLAVSNVTLTDFYAGVDDTVCCPELFEGVSFEGGGGS